MEVEDATVNRLGCHASGAPPNSIKGKYVSYVKLPVSGSKCIFLGKSFETKMVRGSAGYLDGKLLY